MKVISGKLKGRTIKGFDISGTRPTIDRVKESVFGMIQNYIHDSIVLDLFAGSGNYGIECLSNGASTVYFNDKNKKCLNIIKENLSNFNIQEDSIILNMDYKEALNYFKNKKIKFDLIFLDPPYKEHIITDILLFLEQNDLLNNNGLVICEMTNSDEYLSDNLVLFKDRKYGDKKVLIYKMLKNVE